ncbi:MAG: hypothetical protein Q4Q06_01255 [Bacteroidota bacterium]|nr:hypothetical protein [Bacteroidota bacterium]
MEELQNILVSIEKKVKQLALEKVDLEELLLRKNREIEILKTEIEQLKLSNNNLNTQTQGTGNNNIINNSDKTEYRLIINDLLNKIDSSISLIENKENADNA